MRPKKFTYFIGVDVSRNKLDYAVMHHKTLLFHREAKNEPGEILAFVTELKGLPGFKMAKAVFCMEQTGIYCNHLLQSLKGIKAHVSLENPLHIKNSLGLIRGKYDKIDAIRIAAYAQKNSDEIKLWVPRRLVLLQLSHLFTLRSRLVTISHALRTPLKEQLSFIKSELQNQDTQSCKKSVEAIKKDLADIVLHIETLINADEHLKKLRRLITSVPGVGLITAVQIMISTNEYRDFRDPKKFACYAGIAPFRRESGFAVGKAKVSHFANKKVKTLLHTCAVCALRCDPELKAYFERKTKTEGKPKMAVINAIRYKLILRIFACLNQDRIYEKGYIRPESRAGVNGTAVMVAH